jgi:dihydropteroate synthase/dihydroneopterin aldolase
MVDVGGESTRPGAEPVAEAEELARVIPVIEGLRGAAVSIDTTKARVAREALAAGASFVNDVSAFRQDPGMAALVAEAGVGCCLMHMLGEPRTMQSAPRYDDVVSEVKAFLAERLAFAVGEGVREDRIVLDPGIGFGKTVEHNLELVRRLDELAALGRPLLVGASRKAFIGAVTDRPAVRRGRSRRPRSTSSPTSAGRGSSASTTCRRPAMRWPWPLLRCGRMARERDDDDGFDDDDELIDDDEERDGPEVGVTIEIVGLSLYTHHGVTAAEREIGQRLVLDVRFEAGEPDALVTDRVEDTVDYAEVCQVIALIAQQRSYKTLERLCAVIADRLASQFGAESVYVKAAKPEPPIPLPVEEVSVEVWREER